MSAPLDHQLRAFRTPALADGRSLLDTLATDGARDLQATVQILPCADDPRGMEGMRNFSLRPGPLPALAASGETSTFLLTPALVVLADGWGDLLRRLGPDARPGPSFVGCAPASVLDWLPKTLMRALARRADQHLEAGAWDLAHPPSAHARLERQARRRDALSPLALLFVHAYHRPSFL